MIYKMIPYNLKRYLKILMFQGLKVKKKWKKMILDKNL